MAGSSKYKGVSWYKNRDTYEVYFRKDGHKKFVCYEPDEILAHMRQMKAEYLNELMEG